MAKRTQTGQPRSRKSKAADTAADAAAQAAPPRAASPAEELPNVPEPGDAADRAQQSESRPESAAREPDESEIRVRAYHRYLERGGDHGRHFDDWLEAKEELKRRESKESKG